MMNVELYINIFTCRFQAITYVLNNIRQISRYTKLEKKKKTKRKIE